MAILGIDPGFSSLGTAVLSLQGGGGSAQTFDEANVFRTQKDKKKVLVWDDNVKRCQQIHTYLSELCDINNFIMFAIEAESWTRMPSDKQLGLARGVIYSVAASFDIPIVQITAKDVKHFLTGSKKASKEDVLTALTERSNLEKKLVHLPRGQWQHAADAAGCALYAWECSELSRLYRRTLLST
tara:strand:- start:2450 stop:3001 length:552 start_codon:yes stop_codon:yes gene_type:complete